MSISFKVKLNPKFSVDHRTVIERKSSRRDTSTGDLGGSPREFLSLADLAMGQDLKVNCPNGTQIAGEKIKP